MKYEKKVKKIIMNGLLLTVIVVAVYLLLADPNLLFAGLLPAWLLDQPLIFSVLQLLPVFVCCCLIALILALLGR